MDILVWAVSAVLMTVAAIWMIVRVFKDIDVESGVFAMLYFPYAIRHAYRKRVKNPGPLALFGTAIAIMILYFPLAIHNLIPNEQIDFVGVVGYVAVGGIMSLPFLLIAVAICWMTMIVYDREGILSGFLAILFWPYAVYYGIAGYRMNRMPVVLGAAGLVGLLMIKMLS